MFNQKSKLGLLIILILCTLIISGCAYNWPHMPSPTDVLEQVIDGISNFGESLQDMFQGFGRPGNF